LGEYILVCRAAASVGLSTMEVGISSGWRRGDVEVCGSVRVRPCNRECGACTEATVPPYSLVVAGIKSTVETGIAQQCSLLPHGNLYREYVEPVLCRREVW
jgi:hypothetical protein